MIVFQNVEHLFSKYHFKDCPNITIYGYVGSYIQDFAKANNIPFVPLEVGVTGVKLNKSSISVVKGKTVTLKATISPSNASNKTVVWESGNKSVAKVSAKGVVTGLKKGTTNISVITNNGKKKATCKIIVTNQVKVKSVKLNKKSVAIKKGKTVILKATISPSSATNKTVTWKTSNKKVATVTSSGKVKGVKKGTANITVITKDGKKITKCKVTVK